MGSNSIPSGTGRRIRSHVGTAVVRTHTLFIVALDWNWNRVFDLSTFTWKRGPKTKRDEFRVLVTRNA